MKSSINNQMWLIWPMWCPVGSSVILDTKGHSDSHNDLGKYFPQSTTLTCVLVINEPQWWWCTTWWRSGVSHTGIFSWIMVMLLFWKVFLRVLVSVMWHMSAAASVQRQCSTLSSDRKFMLDMLYSRTSPTIPLSPTTPNTTEEGNFLSGEISQTW